MNTPTKTLRLLSIPVTDALNSERWHLVDPLSITYQSKRDNVTFHIWLFASTSPANPTPFLFVAWGGGERRASVVRAFGSMDQERALSLVGSEIRMEMHLPEGGQFVREDRQRFPWTKFVTEILHTCIDTDTPAKSTKHEVAPRTVEDMLRDVKLFGQIFHKTTARAIAHLSNPTGSQESIQQVMAACIAIGNACRDMEIEAVYWKGYLWDEAIERSDLFIDANVPESYLPDGPQFWYFENALPSDLDPTLPQYAWWTPEWLLSCMGLLRINQNSKRICLLIYIFEKDGDIRETADDSLPRILIRSVGIADEPCLPGYALCMAGLEFMQTTVPRTPFQYSRQVQHAAERRGDKLQPYSIMEVRRIDYQGEQGEDVTSADDSGSSRTYRYSFFQRRHRRRLKEPRKSDGVQVIRVAAGRKLKHLPLMPDAQQKVTKVRR